MISRRRMRSAHQFKSRQEFGAQCAPYPLQLLGLSKMPKLTATVVNCLIDGMKFTDYPDSSITSNIIMFECDKWIFRFLQIDEVINQKDSLKGALSVTTLVEVDGVDQECLTDVLETLDSICWLLSFATQSQVYRNSYQFPSNTGSRHIRSASGMIANPTCTPFILCKGEDFKRFVEQTYPAYRQLHEIRNLPVVFDYLIQTTLPDRPMEIRLLLMFIIFENLKYTFAHSEGIPFINNFFRKSDNTRPQKKWLTYSFQDLVKMALAKANMQNDLASIKNLRDKIIHTGLSGESLEWQQNMFVQMQDILREYLLRILGYKGKFIPYSSRGFNFKEI